MDPEHPHSCWQTKTSGNKLPKQIDAKGLGSLAGSTTEGDTHVEHEEGALADEVLEEDAARAHTTLNHVDDAITCLNADRYNQKPDDVLDLEVLEEDAALDILHIDDLFAVETKED